MIAIKSEDKVVDVVRSMHLSYEDNKTNISISHPSGFAVSVYDKASKVLRYYEVIDGKLVLNEEEQL